MCRIPADPSIRASDRDRESVVWLLREQTGAGRLTVEEFKERMGAALAARTCGELRALLGDLPVSFPPSGPLVPRGGAAMPDWEPHREPHQRPGAAARAGGRRIDWSDVGFVALFCSPLLVAGLGWALQVPAAALLLLTVLALLATLTVAG